MFHIETIDFYNSEIEYLEFATWHIENTVYATKTGHINFIGSKVNDFRGRQTEFGRADILGASIRLEHCKSKAN